MNNKKSFSIREVLDKYVGTAFLLLFIILYTVILTDGYFNVSTTKKVTFYLISLAFLVATVIQIRVPKLNEGFYKRMSFIFPVLLLISAFIGIIPASEKKDALLGVVEYGFGPLFIMVMLIDVLFFAGRKYNEELIVKAVYAISIFSAAFALLQFIGVDVLWLRREIAVYQPLLFISTLGNLGFFGIFIVVMFALIIYGYLNGLGKKSFRVLAVIACSVGVVISNTDATIVGLVVMLFLGFYLTGKDLEKQKSFLELVFIMGLCWFVLGVLWHFLCTPLGLTKFYSLQEFITSYKFSILVIAIGLLVKELIRIDVYKEKAANIMGKISLVVGIAVIPVYTLITLVYTKIFSSDWGVDYIQPIYFNERWGSFRGFIWKAAVEMIKDGSFVQLIFGHGVGSFSGEFVARYNDYVREAFSGYFNDAHNIYLQWTYEYGLLGLVCLVGTIVVAAKAALNAKESFKRYVGLAILAFAIISAFLVIQCITPVYLLLLLCLLVGEPSGTRGESSRISS